MGREIKYSLLLSSWTLLCHVRQVTEFYWYNLLPKWGKSTSG